MRKTIFSVSALILAVGLGFGLSHWLTEQMPESAQESAQEISAGGEREVLFWRNPMNPAITSPVFSQDEMGMDYLPVYADGAAASDGPVGTVMIDARTVQNIGVRTASAERASISRQIRALGHVDFNEERLLRLHPKVSGWIEALHVGETGTTVDEDSILLSIYSPELLSAQQEYLLEIETWERSRSAAAKRVMESALARLRLVDVPEHQLKELRDQRRSMRELHIHSPFGGSVMNIGVREGQYVTPSDELYLIADLSRIWVYVDIYEDQLPWVRIGDSAELRLRAAPGQVFSGQVAFIPPMLERQTRTVRVRIEVNNPGLKLKPGMFAEVDLHVATQAEAVVVPSEAIVRSGLREQVFVASGDGHFEPREVVLGLSAEGRTQILSGVDAGEQVVVSSQFLIDSESKLREATAKMAAALAGPMDHAGHDMSDMDMGEMSMDDMDMSDMSMDEVAQP